MQKSERLFQLTNLLRGRRTAITARQLSERLGVSERTIYRDIQTLELSGIPIEGEAGVGYRIRHDFELPPLMFDREEVLALILGSRMVSGWGDPELSAAAKRALAKIEAILPDSLKQKAAETGLLVPEGRDAQQLEFSRLLRSATEQQRQVELDYRREDGQTSQRRLDPLAQVYWGGKWTLVAWCHLRDDYRQFRVDRMLEVRILSDRFELTDQHCLHHYLSIIGIPAERLGL